MIQSFPHPSPIKQFYLFHLIHLLFFELFFLFIFVSIYRFHDHVFLRRKIAVYNRHSVLSLLLLTTTAERFRFPITWAEARWHDRLWIANEKTIPQILFEINHIDWRTHSSWVWFRVFFLSFIISFDRALLLFNFKWCEKKLQQLEQFVRSSQFFFQLEIQSFAIDWNVYAYRDQKYLESFFSPFIASRIYLLKQTPFAVSYLFTWKYFSMFTIWVHFSMHCIDQFYHLFALLCHVDKWKKRSINSIGSVCGSRAKEKGNSK